MTVNGAPPAAWSKSPPAQNAYQRRSDDGAAGCCPSRRPRRSNNALATASFSALRALRTVRKIQTYRTADFLKHHIGHGAYSLTAC